MMSYSARAARRGANPNRPVNCPPQPREALDADELAKLRELVKDAETCGRLNNFEQNFMADRQAQLLQYGDNVLLSEAQKNVLRGIEEKVYACG